MSSVTSTMDVLGLRSVRPVEARSEEWAGASTLSGFADGGSEEDEEEDKFMASEILKTVDSSLLDRESDEETDLDPLGLEALRQISVATSPKATNTSPELPLPLNSPTIVSHNVAGVSTVVDTCVMEAVTKIPKAVRKPLLHAVVLFASDPKVMRFAQEVQLIFVGRGIDVFLQTEVSREAKRCSLPFLYMQAKKEERPDAMTFAL